jgi:secretion/DNA translocation related TadE-like protein
MTIVRRLRSRADERGSATLLMMAAGLLVLVCGMAVVLWSAVSTAHHRAAAAADLAALSGAQAIQSDGDPCAAALRIAGKQGASLDACTVYGEEVLVVAGVRAELGSLGRPVVRSTARAGTVQTGG